MEATTTPHPDYIKGFNEGYTISKYMPELADELLKSVGESTRSIGFKDGRNQYSQELAKEKYPKWLQKERSAPGKTQQTPTKTKIKGRSGPEKD